MLQGVPIKGQRIQTLRKFLPLACEGARMKKVILEHRYSPTTLRECQVLSDMQVTYVIGLRAIRSEGLRVLLRVLRNNASTQ